MRLSVRSAPSRPPDAAADDGGVGRHVGLGARVRALVQAIQTNDDAQIEEAVLRLSHSQRIYAPLGLAVGAVIALFQGVKLLVTNWRLTLVQVLPAMWIWLATFDLKLHVLHDRSFNALRGAVLIPLFIAVTAITVASFFLNAVFGFAVSRPGRPEIRPAFDQARRHLAPIAACGTVVGLLLSFSTLVVTRWGRPWFCISLSIVVGLMMMCYVAVPARLVGIKPASSPRDKLMTTLMGGALSATVCTPPYLLGRAGLLMLGSKALLFPGIFVLAVGVTLQAGATGAVRAIKISARLAVGQERDARSPTGARTA